MPIGTIIGFLAGAFITATFILWTEFDDKLTHQRKTEVLWIAEHRCRYLFWAVSSLCGLVGTFIELNLR
jgi:hypothetical protein